MLILTRHQLENIIINDDICLTILGINGKHVKLGIAAPKNLPIHREEIYKKIKLEQCPRLQRKRKKIVRQKGTNKNK